MALAGFSSILSGGLIAFKNAPMPELAEVKFFRKRWNSRLGQRVVRVEIHGQTRRGKVHSVANNCEKTVAEAGGVR